MAGLSFAALTNAALGGGAAWNTGKREGRADKLKENQTAAALARQVNLDRMTALLHQSQIAENEAQRQHYLLEAKKIQNELDHPKAVAPVLGSPEYLKAEGDLANVRAQAGARYRAPTEGETDRASGFSAADARKSKMADDFASRYVEMFQGNAPKAVKYIEGNPALKAEATRLGMTEGHYNAATARRSRVNPGTQKSTDTSFEELSSDAPVATASSSAPQPARPIGSSTTARALEASIPSLAPAVVRAPNTSANAGTSAPRASVPTSTPKANPMRANSPKAGTPSEVPSGADPEKYRTDKRYRMWVDSISATKR